MLRVLCTVLVSAKYSYKVTSQLHRSLRDLREKPGVWHCVRLELRLGLWIK